MTRYFSILPFLLGCISCSALNTQQAGIPAGFSAPPARFDDAAAARDRLTSNVALQDTALSIQNLYANTYRISFGPQLVIVRASYRDGGDRRTTANDHPTPTNLQGYFDLRASAALAGTNLIAEGEMASGVLDSSGGNIRPEMLGFAIKHRWRDLTYGVDYKSVAKGFTTITGTIAEQARNEALIWSEQDFGALKLGASIGQGSSANEKSTVVINRFTTSFRPSDLLVLEPNLSLKEEWNQTTGARTQTPSSGLSFTYAPVQSAFRLTGGSSYSRIFSRDGSNDIRIHSTSAAIDWRLGKFLGRDDLLSFTFNYTSQLDYISRNNSHRGLSSMLQFKIAGF